MGNFSNKRLIVCFLVLLLIIIIVGGVYMVYSTNNDLEFTAELKAGWNLGNSLDVHDLPHEPSNLEEYETYWGNPPTTAKMIKDIKKAGFQTIRIPVTWYEHVDEDFTIDEEWLQRVTEIVDMSIASGLQVIINAHHDDWYIPDEEHFPAAKEKMKYLWTQIGDQFEDYDEQLIFESMNEPRLIGTGDEWTPGTKEAQEIVNQLNAVFVETIRGLDGYNQERYLLLPTYAARYEDEALEAFELPEGERLMVSIHLYAPVSFAQTSGDESDFDSSNESDTQVLTSFFNKVEEQFMRKDIPVVITEFAASDKDNLSARVDWTEYIVKKSRELDIPYIWWDQGGRPEGELAYRLYDRHKRQWVFPELVEILTK